MTGEIRERSRRLRLLRTLDKVLAKPMIGLAFLWLALITFDLTIGLSSFWQTLSLAIWAVFIGEFFIKVALAPHKTRFLAKNWLTALALLVPALRVLRPLRILRVARVARGANVVRVLGSLNRGMRALGRTMGRRGLAYVLVLTIVVATGGAAGMHAFERNEPGNGFDSYPESLWWTAMILTTTGSASWPITSEGRVLAFVLSLYAFSVFGYLAAAMASFFVERDAADSEAETIGKTEYRAIMTELEGIRRQLNGRVQ